MLLLVVLAARASGQKEVFVPANDVSFTIATEHRKYQTGAQIIVRYEITNISKGSVYVPREWDVKCPASPHIWVWFENGAGQHFIPGYAGDCFPSKQTIVERMKQEAVLLKPGQRLQGHLSMETNLFGGLEPGAYRIEAALYGWNERDFDEQQRNELKKMPASFMRGEVPASAHIMLIR